MAANAAPIQDRAAELLASTGSLPVSHAGPYVEIGTYLVQVQAKLGRPDLRLPDGTWLYHGHNVENSAATGTLVVRFKNQRVNALSLVGPAVVATLEAKRREPGASNLVTTK